MFGIQIVGQIISIIIFSKVQVDEWNAFGGFDNGKINYYINGEFSEEGVQGNTIFVFVNNIYLVSVLAFSISHPWRKQFYTNIPFVIVTLLALIYNILCCMVPALDWSLFNLKHFKNNDIRLYLLIASLGFAFFIYITQKCIFEPLTYRIIRKYPKIKWI